MQMVYTDIGLHIRIPLKVHNEVYSSFHTQLYVDVIQNQNWSVYAQTGSLQFLQPP